MMSKAIALCILMSISVLYLDRVIYPSIATSENYSLEDPRDVITKYCEQHADSVAKGIDVVAELIGAGIVPNSYYGYTCQNLDQQAGINEIEQID